MEEVKSLESELEKIEEEQEVWSGAAAPGALQEADAEAADKETDSVDAASRGSGSTKFRQEAKTLTAADDDDYSMKHPRRGDCIIFAHGKYDPKTRIGPRDSVDHDTKLCVEAFSKLGFEARIYKDCTTEQMKMALSKESKKNRSDCDAFVVIFMSHGDYKDGKEILHTYDSEIDTSALWEPFVGDKCPTLAGKPKLVFIQACRGTKIDIGVGLRVSKDSTSKKSIPSYVIPAHADLLVMWASYKGMFAFKSTRLGIRGSVFIHFLADILEHEGYEKPLHDLLIKVTRRVALDFESQCPNTRLDHNKQVPHTSSTLMRRVVFTPKQPTK